jgi:hypothetical protein
MSVAGFNHSPFLRTTRQKLTSVWEYSLPAALLKSCSWSETPSLSLRTKYMQSCPSAI